MTIAGLSEDDVRDKLKDVMDPELDINIVDLGLIYEIDIKEDEVFILMTLTTPGCPLHGIFDEMVRREVGKLENLAETDIEVELTFEPRWSPDMVSEEGQGKLGHLPGMQGF